jgi:RNA polymerase sigma-70 factor (ECF subfamily)
MVFSKSITFDDDGISRAVPVATSSTSTGDDALFIENLRRGNAAAFDQLVERYSGDIYALLYRLTENAEEASDLTQDTFLRALKAVRSFRGDASLKTWLFRIAINESRNRFRWWKRRRRDATISLEATIGDTHLTVSDTLADRSRSPEESAISNEREYALNAALLEIPVVYREAIVLCDIEGFSYEETASALGVGLGTVKSRISRGREDLRRRLKDF